METKMELFQRYLGYTSNSLPTLVSNWDAFKSGERKMLASQYKDMCSAFERNLERIADKIQQDLYPRESATPEEFDTFTLYPSLMSWKRYLRDISPRQDTPYIKKMKEFYLDFAPLVLEMIDLIKLLEILKGVVAKEHKMLVEQSFKFYHRYVKEVREIIPTFNTLSYKEQVKVLRNPDFGKFFDVELEGLALRKYKISEKVYLYSQIDRSSETDAQRVEDFFLSRSLQKLTPIISAKGAVKDLTLIFSCAGFQTISCDLKVSFEDGSSFIVRHKVVGVYGGNGYFYRFPTTFHDVVLADGKKMSRPSEERMHSVFSGKS